jgi:hypothetical protein
MDLVKTRLLLKKGDIVLVGDEKCFFATAIQSPITHAMMYLGNKRFINATCKGVRFKSLHEAFTLYDTLAILRIKSKKAKQITKKAMVWAVSQYGKPYDFNFKKGADAFFCSELINEAFKEAGYKTKLRTVKKPKTALYKIVDKYWDGKDCLHPEEFITRGNFAIIFLSHNLLIEKRKLIYLSEKYKARMKKPKKRTKTTKKSKRMEIKNKKRQEI